MVIRKRLEISGPAMVFVTTTVTGWTPVFTLPETGKVVLEQLKETLTFYGISLVGYALMPTHLHMILGLPKVEELSRFVQTFKSLSSRRVKELEIGAMAEKLNIQGEFRLWKPRFDDVVIFSEKQFRIKLDYIHNNPVKAGLVNRPTDWPFSSASQWFQDNPGLIAIDKQFMWLHE
ncbi:MAG: transposase [candidate division Zixibacteria bacterium]|nr:transposase [candidate division Zixibacteria bacterium]